MAIGYPEYMLTKYSGRVFTSDYHVFTIKTKQKERTISAPDKELKELKNKIQRILDEIYQPKKVAHGFIKNKSIRTNASIHCNKKFVVNIDIKGFFDAIHFGRVKGMLESVPYNFSLISAKIFANICCYQYILPQGAPTSPVISNMIMAKLDSDLKKHAIEAKVTYSRYADDITFSSRNSLSPMIAYLYAEEWCISDSLSKIISDNGFEINHAKFRVLSKKQRQEVTGVTVNRILNVQRKYIRQIRAELDSIGKKGLGEAQRIFEKSYLKRNPAATAVPNFLRSLESRIEYVGYIRGNKEIDNIYKRYKRQYLELMDKPIPQYLLSFNELIDKTVFIMESFNCPDTCNLLCLDGKYCYDIDGNFKDICDAAEDGIIYQSTCFVLNGHLVSCAHGVKDYNIIKEAVTNRIVSIIPKNKVSPLITDDDIAVLKRNFSNIYTLHIHSDNNLSVNDDLKLVGFPQHQTSATVQTRNAKITGFNGAGTNREIIIDTNIVYGNSGGPILKNEQVIGFAHKGIDSEGNISPNTVKPINLFSPYLV